MTSPADRTLVVAIDGPSGAGKSTVSRRVALARGLRYLDTGSLYRALTFSVLGAGIDTSDTAAVSAHATRVVLDAGTDPAEPSVSIDGRRVDREIREPDVTAAVSAVSEIPAVRELLLVLQRRLIGGGGIVVEGRDIGTVVVPAAPVKIFLTASGDARAQRRAAESTADVQATLSDLERRDRHDSGRTTSPLAKAPDAIEIDATSLDVDEVVARVLEACEAAVAASSPSARRDDAGITEPAS
jgi:cytidylate kinase